MNTMHTGFAGQAFQSATPGPHTPDTIMTSSLRSARATADELTSACVRLENLRARLFGHDPVPPSTKEGGAPIPQGAVYELGIELERHQALVNRLHGVITDLEPLA